MTSDHPRLREALGAYVLGALDADERHAVEAHVRDCPSCTDEVARLAALPVLLGRLDAAEADAGLVVPALPDPAAAVVAISREQTRRRRQLRSWQMAAVAAAVAAVAATWQALQPALEPGGPPDRLVAPVETVAADAAGVTGTAAALAWEWGTTVEVAVADLPARDRYELWAVSDSGERQSAGSWGPTAAGDAQVRGAAAIQRPDLDRVEVTDVSGDLLVAFDF